MKEKLLVFLFFGILLAFAYHLALGIVYGHYFSTATAFQIYWYVPFVIVPALLLAALAWGMGFGRRHSPRWADAAALLILGGIVFLTLDATYSCGSGCF